ncbi:MAG: hypothetical protein ACREWG_08285 [Gammaproteobacteria bacterium]
MSLAAGVARLTSATPRPYITPRLAQPIVHTDASAILASYGEGAGHVFNLGYGIEPEVESDHVRLVDVFMSHPRPAAARRKVSHGAPILACVWSGTRSHAVSLL